MARINDFFQDLDGLWQPTTSNKTPLCIIGCSALLLQTDYARGSKDSDVLETAEVSGAVKESLLALAGKGSRLHKRHGHYLDIVAPGLPFLPQQPLYHPTALNQSLRNLEIAVLDVIDVVVSKLKRFSANDVADIRAMVGRDLVEPARLDARFRSAVETYLEDARAPDLPKYIENLNTVQRDMLLVPESKIDLPDWI